MKGASEPVEGLLEDLDRACVVLRLHRMPRVHHAMVSWAARMRFASPRRFVRPIRPPPDSG
jgi:hypothetical protein